MSGTVDRLRDEGNALADLRLTATGTELAELFAEWDRRYREDPSGFMSDVEHLLGETPEQYGEACAAYFLKLAGVGA